MAVSAGTPIELVNKVYGTLVERAALGRKRLGRPLTLTEKILINHLDDPANLEHPECLGDPANLGYPERLVYLEHLDPEVLVNLEDLGCLEHPEYLVFLENLEYQHHLYRH